MANSLDELLRIAAAPNKPNASTLSRHRELDIAGVTIPLPKDWVNFGQVYGSGSFRDTQDFFFYLWIYNPLSPEFERRADEICELERASEAFREQFAVFPEKGGLLPLGEDNCDHALWYVVTDSPENWPILVINRAFESRIFETRLIPFLVALLAGRESIWDDEKNPFPNGVRFCPGNPK